MCGSFPTVQQSLHITHRPLLVMATQQLTDLDVALHHRGLGTMSDDNVDRGTIPFRVRDSVKDPAPGSPAMHSPKSPSIDIAK